MNRSRSDTLTQDVAERVRDRVEDIKPRLRGWLHLGTLPLAFFGFLVLLVIADSALARAAAAVFMVSSILLFGVSAIYHTVNWSQTAKQRLKRLDHANIFVLIAGSYTPFALLVLDTVDAIILLCVVWGGALLGVLFKVFWLNAPRWLYVPLYIVLGWAAVFWLDDFGSRMPTAALVLVAVGGGLYTLGAIVYGFKWPDPAPRWFGYHEIFHTFTVAAFIVHYIGVSILAYSR